MQHGKREVFGAVEFSSHGELFYLSKRRVVYFGYKSIVHACDASKWPDMHSVCIKRSMAALARPKPYFQPAWYTSSTLSRPLLPFRSALLYCDSCMKLVPCARTNWHTVSVIFRLPARARFLLRILYRESWRFKELRSVSELWFYCLCRPVRVWQRFMENSSSSLMACGGFHQPFDALVGYIGELKQ